MSVSRRDFMALLGTSVAVTVAGSAVLVAAGAPTNGAAGKWIVEHIGAVSKGAIPVTLRNDATGEVLRVEACRRGLAANPVAKSAQFDLFLANDGKGHAQTNRDHVAAVQGLAAHLDRTVHSVPAAVQTMGERLSAHAELHTTADDVLA
ncbi:MAG: hypothetical protein FJ100_15250 [Deltaproteobacteria bacterium]|nr:hypothetical protein [Deltaproteobacteria bacterium]